MTRAIAMSSNEHESQDQPSPPEPTESPFTTPDVEEIDRGADSDDVETRDG